MLHSIGGTGGLAGDFGGIADGSYIGMLVDPTISQSFRGSGGDITLKMALGKVKTSGAHAPAIFAQSLGGGGGLVATTDRWYKRVAWRSGRRSGHHGSDRRGQDPGRGGYPHVIATGPDPDGVFLQSEGQSGGGILRVAVGDGSSVQGGFGYAYAIRLLGMRRDAATPDVINNAGLIQVDSTPQVGGGASNTMETYCTTVINSGTINGSIVVPPTAEAGQLTVANQPSGQMNIGTSMRLGEAGQLRNAGLVTIGGTSQTVMTGDLAQAATGRLRFDLDTVSGTEPILAILGAATLDGTILANPIGLHKSKKTLLSTTDGVTRAPGFTTEAPYLFSYETVVEGRDLTLTTDADFPSADGAQGGTRASLAGHLQTIWDSGEPGFATGFDALANVQEAKDYTRALDQMSGRAVSAVAAARYDASLRLVNSAFSCPTFAGSAPRLTEKSYTWARVDVADFDRDASGGSIDYSGRSTILTFGGQHGNWAELVPGRCRRI
ncbi:hypothetical protein [Roseovarius sp. M141]|uniref:hypothetical protein n=1 Tax=Roseovarius sp. M141 TaxID=2583806 RepID=UPI0020CBC0D0|nr:hypothetical protein [Roseovarius sp. M141]MCQ0093829.1 hypothetical protein [Roseovarius sp. M141]